MITVELHDGIKIGEVAQRECSLRPARQKDLEDAAKAAAQCLLAPTGRYSERGEQLLEPALLINPYVMEMEVLRRQVVSIGEIDGPLENVYWHFLSEIDIGLIKDAAEDLRAATLAPTEVVQRGRKDGDDESRPASDQPTHS